MEMNGCHCHRSGHRLRRGDGDELLLSTCYSQKLCCFQATQQRFRIPESQTEPAAKWLQPHDGKHRNGIDQCSDTRKSLPSDTTKNNHLDMRDLAVDDTICDFQVSDRIPTGDEWMHQHDHKPLYYDFFSNQDRPELRNTMQSTLPSSERSPCHRLSTTLREEHGHRFGLERCPSSLGILQPHFISDLDLSLKFPNAVVASDELISGGGNISEEEAFASDNQDWSLHRMHSGPHLFSCPAIAFSSVSTGLTETGVRPRQGSEFAILDLFQKRGKEFTGHGSSGYGFGMICSERWQDWVDHPQKHMLHVDSEAQQTKRLNWERPREASREASLSTLPAAISCVDSSECDNFGAEIATGKAEFTFIADVRETSCYSPEEEDAMSEAKKMEKRKKGCITALEINGKRASKEAINVSYGALDLLVSAIQATSGSIAEDEKEKLGSCLEIQKTGIDSEHFVVQRRRVFRRGKSRFSKFISEEEMRKEDKLEATRQFVDLPLRQIGRKKKAKQCEDGENGVKPAVAGENGLLKDGEPLVRSRRGRCQALPTKFADSLIQPWKKKSRRG